MGWNATSRLKDQAGNAKRDWSVTVVFDLADTAWLHAYTHFLSAFSDFLLAFSTTGPITEVMTAAVQSQQLLSLRQVDRFQIDKFIPIIDILAVFLLTLKQTPDPELTRSTQQHLLQMVAHQTQNKWLSTKHKTNRHEIFHLVFNLSAYACACGS